MSVCMYMACVCVLCVVCGWVCVCVLSFCMYVLCVCVCVVWCRSLFVGMWCVYVFLGVCVGVCVYM